MKAVIITQPGGPEVLSLDERPVPSLKPDEILVKVAAAGVNRPDIAQRKGHYPAPEGAPADIPGLEIAGVVIQTGKDTVRFRPGDRVCALVSGGGYAQYCAVPEGQALPVPNALSLPEAASLPETFFTVWSNVFDRARLQPGERLLVHGGSSGIGTTAIQLATALGSEVYTTAGTPEKCQFCAALGAVKAIDYRQQNFREIILAHTAGQGVHVILDMVGGDYTPDNLKLLMPDGRLVLINAMRGREATVDLLEIMRKRLVITGSTLRNRDTAFKAAIAVNLEKYVWPLLDNQQIKPVVYRQFPAEEAAQAHRLMESSTHIGKLVLVFGEE